jgi:hypothetical protein
VPASGSIPREFSGVPVRPPLHDAVIHTDLNDRVPPGAGVGDGDGVGDGVGVGEGVGEGAGLAAGASTL